MKNDIQKKMEAVVGTIQKSSIISKLPSKTSKAKEKKIKEGWCQDNIPLKEIRDGICVTDDGQKVKIIEIRSCNYKQSSTEKKLQIANAFAIMFSGGPITLHIKQSTEKSTVAPIIDAIKKKQVITENTEWYERRKKDHIEGLKNMVNSDSFETNYYLIFKYEGKSSDWNDITNDIYSTVDEFLGVLPSLDCNVVLHQNENDFTCSVLYKFFNPRTCLTESYISRYNRVVEDYEKYNQTSKIKKEPTELDVIAPKGLCFDNPYYYTMDGMYFTHLILNGNTLPSELTTGWLDGLSGNGVDIDIFVRRKDTNAVLMDIERTSGLKNIFTSEKKKNSADGSKEMFNYNSNKDFIKDKLKEEKQNYYEVLIMVTIKQLYLSNLFKMKDIIMKKFKRQPYCTSFVESYKDCRKFFKMYMPFMYIDNSTFNHNYRNAVTESLSVMLPFLSGRTFDETGFPIGIDMDSGDIVAINNFNNSLYTNGNISILGTSGAGKTYLMQQLSSGMFFSGMRTFFLCPVKGHELKYHCASVGGAMINLVPGAKECINLFAIRPENENNQISKGSLLAKQITKIITFTQLCLEKNEKLTSGERNRFNKLLVKIYKDIGITSDDNDSIYENKEKKILKVFPTFSDVRKALDEEGTLNKISEAYLQFTDGTYKNLDGQTNVNLDNSCIVINADEELIGKEMLAPLMYLGFITLYDIVKETRKFLDALILDEVWKFLINDDVGEQVFSLVKIIRGYAGCAIFASQDIEDFLDNKWGKAIVSNSNIKIIKRLQDGEPSECQKVCNTVGIKESRYREAIPRYANEQALIVTPQSKISVWLKTTELQNILFRTDKDSDNARKEYFEKNNLSLKSLAG